MPREEFQKALDALWSFYDDGVEGSMWFRHNLEILQVCVAKQTYPAGTRVRLIHMDDKQSPPIGTCGTVTHVDDAGTVFVRWDNGSGLGFLPHTDKVEIICSRSAFFRRKKYFFNSNLLFQEYLGKVDMSRAGDYEYLKTIFRWDDAFF